MNLYFYGYSDDVVVAGSSPSDVDEYYGEHLLLSNGVTVRAVHGRNGWELSTSEPKAVLIPAVPDADDNGIEHDDERIPQGLNPSAYSPVLIVPCDEATEIVFADSSPFTDTSTEFIFAAKLARELANEFDFDDGIDVPVIIRALKKAGWKGGAK